MAVVFTRLYVSFTLAMQRALIDPWRYVRPEPASFLLGWGRGGYAVPRHVWATTRE